MVIMMASEGIATGRAMPDTKGEVFLRPLRPLRPHACDFRWLREIPFASAYRPQLPCLRPPVVVRPPHRLPLRPHNHGENLLWRTERTVVFPHDLVGGVLPAIT
jgi:hypothetical protein